MCCYLFHSSPKSSDFSVQYSCLYFVLKLQSATLVQMSAVIFVKCDRLKKKIKSNICRYGRQTSPFYEILFFIGSRPWIMAASWQTVKTTVCFTMSKNQRLTFQPWSTVASTSSPWNFLSFCRKCFRENKTWFTVGQFKKFKRVHFFVKNNKISRVLGDFFKAPTPPPKIDLMISSSLLWFFVIF